MDTKPTTAQTISALFGDDGQCWQTEYTAGEGLDESLDALCERNRGRCEYRDGHGTDTYRYTFADGSVITVAGDGWDYGYVGCFCWQGVGHSDECVAVRS